MFLFFLSFIIWSVLHSITAAPAFKARVRNVLGARAYAGWYRLLYNLFAAVSFLPVLYLLYVQAPARVLWEIPAPWRYVTLAIQGVSLALLGVALWQTDIWEFAGVRQALRYLRGAPDPDVTPRFVTSGPYGWVRHPLYLFSMLVLWFTPLMTVGTLIFNGLATLYFGLGSIHEERRLAAAYGEAYREYQRRVLWLPPFWQR